MLTIPGHEYGGACMEGNGSRGHRRGPGDFELIWFCLHTSEGKGAENSPASRFVASTNNPAIPPYTSRSFQSRDSLGRLQWETPDGKRTIDPDKAKRATFQGTVFRPPDPPLNVAGALTPMPWCFGACYDAYADADQGDGGYVLTVDPTEWITNAQGGEEPNERTVDICLPGQSSRTREQWLTGRSRKMIRGAARYFVDVSKALGIPNHRCTLADLVARIGGYCGHNDFSQAFHKSDHGDPGPAFPWDVFAADIAQLLEDDMPRIVTVFDDATWTQVSPEAFVMSGPSLEWVQSLEQLAALTTLGAAKMDPATGKPYGIWRSQLKHFHRTGAVWPQSPFAATEFLSAA